tara:strand:- start:1755 stop:2051 length:297 start_codon:yes stop_codon:yes gene_type:complete
MTEFALAIKIVNDLSVNVSILKKKSDKKHHSTQTKNGLAGWMLYRRAKSADYPHITNGNTITSLVAKEWKLLSKDEKLRWKTSAENPDVCGNRWVNHI